MAQRTYPWIEKDSPYGSTHRLQNYDICLPRPLEESPTDTSVWLFYIHGGAWRDTTQDKSELYPAWAQLVDSSASASSKAALSNIAAIVSVNYGLSTHATDPSSPGNATDPSLSLRHPQHITDIVTALKYFSGKYRVGLKDGSGYRYILVGHSAGATLAFQSWTHRPPHALYSPPLAIVGLAGIYDLPAVVRNHTSIPFYRKMITDAFGEDEKAWEEASPVNQKYGDAWEESGLGVVVLGASREDQLVEMEQWEEMGQVLRGQGWVEGDEKAGGADGRGKELVMLKMKGGHDEMWEKGVELRKAIELVVEKAAPMVRRS